MTEITSISKFRPAEISLDYDRLRAEGVRHLEQLATQIWTDFNAHDPGITILEVLCYAITDLGYRTSQPIENLLWPGPGKPNNPFFSPTELLPSAAVTSRDFRKLLIDLDCIKNAWVCKNHKPEKPLFAGRQLQFKPISRAAALDLLSRFDIEEASIDLNWLLHLNQNPDLINPLKDMGLTDLVREIHCRFAYYPLRMEAQPDDEVLPLNGLYDVIVELDDRLDPDSDKVVEKAKKKIEEKLHNNRNLCEDFVQIKVLKPCPICLCLDLEIEAGANERQVVAEVLYHLQAFLTPSPQFYSFLELKERGLSCADILNGPILEHGFLPDEELDKSPLRQQIFKSDLYPVILGVPQVKAVKELYLKKAGAADYSRDWCLSIADCGLYEETSGKQFYKPVIDVCCSHLRVSKGVLRIKLEEEEVEEALDQLRSFKNLETAKTMEGLPHPSGRYREGLADFLSIQYEFPENYGIADCGLRQGVSDLRRAQSKQLQAFLLFFDQLLAAYLQQLSKVGELLSVHQSPDEATYFYQALYETPGMPSLIRDFAVYKFSPEALQVLEEQQALPEAVLEKLLDRPEDFPDYYTSTQAFVQSLEDLLGPISKTHKELIQQALQVPAKESDWLHYQRDENNYYLYQLEQITENSSARQLRKDQILDHLLARFGEQFTDYVLNLFEAPVAREEDPTAQPFSTYLSAKSRFLKKIPQLAGTRGKAYNYRAMDPLSNEPDVWNTNNIAGLKNRICCLLGIEDCSTRSLFCDPDYEIRLDQGETAEGLLTYQLILAERKEDGNVLLSSRVYQRGRERLRFFREILHQYIDNKEYYRLEEKNDQYQVIFEYPSEQGKIVLQSPELPEQVARNLLLHILELTELPNCESEGFHLVEHILLRPNDTADDLLCLYLEDCSETTKPFPLKDPYSFWLTVVLPDWTRRFKDLNFRRYFEQTFRREAPAHIALRFCWVDVDGMQQFERAFQQWRIEKARCRPDECNVTSRANALIKILNEMKCSCFCIQESNEPFCPVEGE